MDFYIRNKIITLDKETLPCDTLVEHNSDYEAVFHFDEEWNGREKTARFIKGEQYVDVLLIDDRCCFPAEITGAAVEVGVYSGNLKTTSSEYVFFTSSILNKNGTPADPMPDVYTQVMQRIGDYETAMSSIKVPDYCVRVLREGNGAFVTDRTSSQINEAYLRKERCLLEYESLIFPLISSTATQAVFSLEHLIETVLYVYTFEINDSETRLYVRSFKEEKNELVESVKLLGLGDSICSGNSGKGFVGNLGLSYRNVGVSGACLANITNTDSDGNQRTDVPQQLINFRASDSTYYPDAIIADGGVNDYMKHVSLGTMSATPVYTDEMAENLDRSTVIGSLEYLFYQMIKLYPKAQRYFLTVHKMYAYYKAYSKWYYFPVTKNQASGGTYNQQELYEAIVRCCELYNVKLIDIYKNGAINTRFSQYRQEGNPYVDSSDGIHLTTQGYEKMYKPHVKMALGYAAKQ